MLPAKSLTQLVKLLKPAAATPKGTPARDLIRLRETRGVLELTTGVPGKLQMSAELTHLADVPLFDVVVSYSALSKAIGNGPPIKLERDENTLLVTQGARSTTLPLMADLIPDSDRKQQQVAFTLDTGHENILRDLLLPAAAKDQARPVLAGLFVEPAKRTVTFVAADGFRMTIAYLKAFVSREASFIIPADVIKALPSGAHGFRFDLSPDIDWVSLTFHHREHRVRIEAPTVTGHYPDWRQIVPKTTDPTFIKISEQVITEAAALKPAMIRITPNEVTALQIDGTTALARWNGAGSVRFQPPAEQSPVEQVYLNPSFLRDLLPMTSDGYLTLCGESPRAAWCSHGAFASAVVMPMLAPDV